jgi:CubicO group peptidase (beta-lactamase class C family)
MKLVAAKHGLNMLGRLLAPIQVAVIAVAMAVAAVPRASAETCGPTFSATGPDAQTYGEDAGYPLGGLARTRIPRFMVASFTHLSDLLHSETVATSATPSPLRRDCSVFTLRYTFDNQTYSLDDYLARNPTTGFLIARGSTILVERYQYGRSDTDSFTSQSMAKTITAMLFGIAMADGKIRSLNDHASDYVPELKGSAYGETTLRSLLTMSSGVAYSETYDGSDDAAKFGRALQRPDSPGAAILLREYNNREVPEGTRFHYAGSETETLGLVLTAATGQKLPTYASERLWKPLGAEADAAWGVDAKGQVMAHCCFNARLRDYARLALLLANDGGGIIPAAWVREATSAPRDSFRAPRKMTEFMGYGYQTWLLPFRNRMFSLRGIHGQTILVYPAQRLVLVNTAVRVKPNNDPATRELTQLWYALVRHVEQAQASAAPPPF